MVRAITKARRAQELTKSKFVTKVASAARRKKGGANFSRKEVLAMRKAKIAPKLEQLKLKKKQEKRKKMQKVQKEDNKRANKAFDHSTLKLVHEGVVETIEGMGEVVTPLSLFACSHTALLSSPQKDKIPHLLVILTAAIPRLSPNVAMSRAAPLLQLAETLLSNFIEDHLIAVKTMKMVQAVLTSFSPPSLPHFRLLKRLEPNRLNGVLMPLFVSTVRKIVQHAYEVGAFDTFVEMFGDFLSLCVNNFAETKDVVASSTKKELIALIEKVVTPRIVDGASQAINDTVAQLTNLFKPLSKSYWAMAADIITALFSRLSYLKRTSDHPPLLEMLPATSLLLRVLDKLRAVDDVGLNNHIERALCAVGSCMPVAVFMKILPFDPHGNDIEGTNEDKWLRSYVVNIIRRIASHDSLPFFIQEFLPRIKATQDAVKECELSDRGGEAQQWMALHLQYWRVCCGFCHYPTEVTNESFRTLAKTLVGLLSTPLVDTAAQCIHVLCSGYHRLATTEQQEDDVFDSEDENEDEGGATGPQQKKVNKIEDDEMAFLSLSEEGWNTHVFHNISQSSAQEVCQIFGKYSGNIMPKLCNTFETHPTTSVLDAIQSFSQVCSAPVMNTILEGILAVGANLSEGFDGNEGGEQLSAKRRVILDIAHAIIGELPVNHFNSVFSSIVEPVLLDTNLRNRLLQKKAYKLLFAMFEKRLKDLMPHMGRVMNLLAVGQQHVTVSALKMRVKCISWALDAFKMYNPSGIVDFIRHAVGEVVLFAKEQSGDARSMAMEILEKMHRYCVGSGCNPNTMVHLVLAGLAGKTPTLVSCAIVCLAKLVWISHEQLAQIDLNGIVAICFGLLEHVAKEIRSSAATFARMVLKLMKRSPKVATAVEESLQKLLRAIAIVSSQPRLSSSTRIMLRVLVEKSIKRFGEERVESLFPLGSKRFVQYCAKMLRRAEKREEKERRRKADGGKDKDEFTQLFMGQMQVAAAEEEGETDLLEHGALRNFVAEHPTRFVPGEDDDDDDDMCLVTEGGKIRIVSKVDRAKELDNIKRKALADRILHRSGAGRVVRGSDFNEENELRKRHRDDEVDMENQQLIDKFGGKFDEASAARTTAALRVPPAAANSANRRDLELKDDKRAIKRHRAEADIKKGEEFVSQRGLGDVKRGTVDPFAYVPLNRKYLNKRHRHEAEKRFKAIQHRHVKGEKAARAVESARKHD